MTQPASLIYYLRFKYQHQRQYPAPADLIGAIQLWIAENFVWLSIDKLTHESLSHQFTLRHGENFTIITCYCGYLEVIGVAHKHLEKFYYDDPNFFVNVQIELEKHFMKELEPDAITTKGASYATQENSTPLGT